MICIFFKNKKKFEVTLGFLMTKNPWLLFRLKHEISKQNFFEFSFMKKMLIIQFQSMEKMVIIQFHI